MLAYSHTKDTNLAFDILYVELYSVIKLLYICVLSLIRSITV